MYIFNNGLLPANVKRLALLGTSNFDIAFIAMDKVSRQMCGDTNKRCGDYVTMTIYFCLFIADMFCQYDKAIYIELDTVAEDDLTTLLLTDLGDNLVLGVADPVMMTYPETMTYI